MAYAIDFRTGKTVYKVRQQLLNIEKIPVRR